MWSTSILYFRKCQYQRKILCTKGVGRKNIRRQLNLLANKWNVLILSFILPRKSGDRRSLATPSVHTNEVSVWIVNTFLLGRKLLDFQTRWSGVTVVSDYVFYFMEERSTTYSSDRRLVWFKKLLEVECFSVI